MPLYTKTGDDGTTGLFGGKRLPKDDPVVSCYGTIDEFNSYLGFVIAVLPSQEEKDFLLSVQKDLLVIGGCIAGAKTQVSAVEPKITEMETRMDSMWNGLPPLHGFILPTGSREAAAVHVARSVCRRAERTLVSLKKRELHMTKNDLSVMIRYLNRLSDYLFALARWTNKEAGVADIEWK